MAKIIDLKYQGSTRKWCAEVRGKVFQGRTARVLRGDVTRALGNADAEFRVTFDRAMEKELESIVRRTRLYKKERRKLDVMLDKLNMERYKVAERARSFRCSTEQVATRLEMHTTALAQMMDPRTSSGLRVKALLKGEIKPGFRAHRAGRGGESGEE